MFELKTILPLAFLVLGITMLFLTFKIKLEKDVQKDKKTLEIYFTRELGALFARKKEIPSSFFIKVDCSRIIFVNDDTCKYFYEQAIIHAKNKMTNLKQYTNLELKESYGMSQFELLTQYEKNYLTFIDFMVKYGIALYEKDFVQEAKAILEAALDYRCDVSKCYFILSDIYLKLNDKTALVYLRKTAEENMQGSYYLNKVLLKIKDVTQAIDS